MRQGAYVLLLFYHEMNSMPNITLSSICEHMYHILVGALWQVCKVCQKDDRTGEITRLANVRYANSLINCTLPIH